MAEIKKESIVSCFEEIEKLAGRNYEEAKFYDYFGEMRIDKKKYAALEENGNLCFFAFRNAAGELVGYAFYLLMFSMLSKALIAENGAFYLIPEERKGFAANKLLFGIEKELKACGVDVLIHRSRIEYDVSPLFLRAGFTLQEKVFVKNL